MAKNKIKKKKPNKQYAGLGHISEHSKASRALYRYFWSLSAELNIEGSDSERLEMREKYHRFLVHLYVSMSHQVMDKEKYNRQQGMIPISSRLIEREFGRDFDIHLLKKNKLIEIKGHDTARRRSREFRLRGKIWRKAVRIEFDSILGAWDDLCEGRKSDFRSIVNSMTGRTKTSSVKSKYTKDEGGTRNTNLPELIKNSMKSFKPCPFNPKYVGKYVKGLQNKYKREKSRIDKIKKQYGKDREEYVFAEKEYLRARGRYYNDLFCMRAILNQNPEKLKIRSTKDEPLYQYKAAYSVQVSGRIAEISGGFQSANKFFKQRFFRRMTEMKKNYDLKNSQANILLQELKACKIKCAWLESYLDDGNAKNKYAKKVGIPVEVWKECFYSTIMGADAKGTFGAVFNNLKKHYSGDEKKAKTAHQRFQKIAKELILVTEQWRDYIYKTENRRYHYKYHGVKYWKNACGMHFKDYGISEVENGKSVLINRRQADKEIRSAAGIKKCKRKLAAFILQGQEACFIHNLTIICSENDIPVYKNEHDGIITGKKIPKTLIKRAAKLSGLKKAKLKRKPICSRDKREEMKDYLKA